MMPTVAPDTAPAVAPPFALGFDLGDFSAVRDRLRLRLMSEERRPDVGERFYCRRIGETDLYAIVAVDVSSCLPDGAGHALATPALRDAWLSQGYSEDEIWASAMAAEAKRDYSVRAIWEVLADIDPAFDDKPAMHEGLPLYAVTTKEPSFGAAGILLPDVQKRVHERCGDSVNLIFSSIHETLVLPTVCAPDAPDLVDMVRSINASVVDEKEVLSNHLYRLDKDGSLIIVL